MAGARAARARPLDPPDRRPPRPQPERRPRAHLVDPPEAGGQGPGGGRRRLQGAARAHALRHLSARTVERAAVDR